MTIKKQLLLAALAVATIAVGATTGTALAGADKTAKPPKAAIDKMRAQLEAPSQADPDSISGMVDPAKDRGVALVLRDPATGNVLRDPATGLPQVARDAAGNVMLFKGNEVPDDQRQAQARLDAKMKRAGDGDVAAQNEINDENAKTAAAVKAHPNGK